MRYLITGSKGFIGRNLIAYMDRKGIKYHTDHLRPNINYIIHLSAATNVRESIKDPIESFKKNTQQTHRLLYQARKWKVADFIFASSMGVIEPKSPYLASKVSGEAYCTAFRESYNLNTHIARLSNVYGPCSEFKDSIIPKFIKAALNKETFFIYGNGTQTRDFIYVEDVVKNLLTLSLPLTPITSGMITSINSLVLMLSTLSIKHLGYAPSIKHKQLNAGEIDTVKPTNGVYRPTLLIKGLEDTFKWFIEHQ